MVSAVHLCLPEVVDFVPPVLQGQDYLLVERDEQIRVGETLLEVLIEIGAQL